MKLLSITVMVMLVLLLALLIYGANNDILKPIDMIIAIVMIIGSMSFYGMWKDLDDSDDQDK